MSERQGDASATADAAAVLPSRMDRFIDKIEFLAAVFIGIVAADVFITVVLRWFNTSIPDSYNFGQFLLGILIF
jgi:TRAP-type transport system small permease protein